MRIDYVLNDRYYGDYYYDFVLTEMQKAQRIIGMRRQDKNLWDKYSYLMPTYRKEDIDRMKEQGIDVDVIIGTRSKSTLILEEEMKKQANNLYICTDDGSYGIHGRVTDVIKELVESKEIKYDEIIAIGPLVMMKFVAIQTKEYEIKTIVSLNPLMIDGTGMCGACRVSVGKQVKFACIDGPDFNGHLVDFDELIKRQKMFVEQEQEALKSIED